MQHIKVINKKISAMYFSPTNTTKKVVTYLSESIKEELSNEEDIYHIDFTLPKGREKEISFSKNDIVIVGVPVYAGRVPNILLKFLSKIKGNGAIAIAVVVYGNRNYDDALLELKDILQTNDFIVIGAGAFIGEHSFSKILAKNRPDDIDLKTVKEFAYKITIKIKQNHDTEVLFVKGNKPYRNYYRPINKEGIPVDIRKVKPKTNEDCINCKKCVEVCPMGSIDYEDVSRYNGICIKCGSCIKKCPVNAKYYDDEDYLRHKRELEIDFKDRREPEIFI